MFIKIGNLEEGNTKMLEDAIEFGDLCINTEDCGFPVVISFRADELHNLLMKLISNPEMTKIAVFSPGYEKKHGEGSKKEFMDSVPVPETPDVTKNAILFLRKAAIAKLMNDPESFEIKASGFEIEASGGDVVLELGKGLDKRGKNNG